MEATVANAIEETDIKDVMVAVVKAAGRDGMRVPAMIAAVQNHFVETEGIKISESEIRRLMQDLLEFDELDLNFKWHLIDPEIMREILREPIDWESKDNEWVVWS